MNVGRFKGLLIGLAVTLVTAGFAAGGARPGLRAAPASAVLGSMAIPEAQQSGTPAAITPLAPSPTLASSPTALPTTALPPSPEAKVATPATAAPSPSAVPTLTPTTNAGEIIGQSVLGRPIVAHRIGTGPIKVVLVGGIHGSMEANTHLLAQQLLAHFQAQPEEVPAHVSLWIIPAMNPDGLQIPDRRWNAHDVDLNRNADTDLDGCAGNDWSPDTTGLEGEYPGAGGPYPFSEPEARAVRDFMADAWIAVFYHSAAEAIFTDTCQRHVPTARLAQVLSAATGYPVPEEGWTGYPITGEFGDYLAGEGVAAVTVEMSDHEEIEFERNLAGVRAMLSKADGIVSAEADQAGGQYIWLNETSTGTWHYAVNSFVHPIALEVLGNTAYLLDAGRVLALDLASPAPPHLLLAPGDYVKDVRVLEPLDLAIGGTSLLVLDRAGDVYRYDPAAADWSVEHHGRPSGDTGDDYFVALAADGNRTAYRYLLETTHEQVWRYADEKRGATWAKLPLGRDVDVSVASSGVYALTRAMNGPAANLLRYHEGRQTPGFQPGVVLMQPRQVVATAAAVYVLDRAGRRLVALDPESGVLLALYQFTDRRAVSAVWADPAGQRLILAGRDALYFYDEPDRAAAIGAGPVLEGLQPHDLSLLADLRGLQVPIEGATLTRRDFQMPGAPRHYRLGVHEGMDFYSATVGVPVNRSTPVRAVADGVVIRAMTDYQPLTAAQANAWAAECERLGFTPPEVLDGYRGRQVWIDHGNGLVSRYAHLGSIEPGIVEGATVTKGQVIGRVGNSGTPSSVHSETEEVHLHLELWLGDPAADSSGQAYYLGQFLRPIEAREWLERMLR
jgi:murein DD-endopeptidase MepM/ murein hydrolase activator NlpD